MTAETPFDTPRDRALAAFYRLTGLVVASITYAGHERETTRYTFRMADGRELRIRDKVLWSPTEFEREVTVRLRCEMTTGERAEWKHAIKALLLRVAEEIPLDGEGFEDVVREWVSEYAAHAVDADTREARDEAVGGHAPYIEDGRLHVYGSHLLRYVRREKQEQVTRPDLFQALRDLGFRHAAINFYRPNGNGTPVRSSASYYVAPLDAVQGAA